MRTYQGSRKAGEQTGAVIVNASGATYPLAMRRNLRDHADAYAWGKPMLTSTPETCATLQLALAMCADALGDDKRALNVHAVFARVALQGLGDEWEMCNETVCELVADLEQALTDAPAADEPAELAPMNGEGSADFERAMNPRATVAVAPKAIARPSKPEQSEQSNVDPVTALNDAKKKVLAAVKAHGFTEAEMAVGGLIASWRSAQMVVEAGLAQRDPDLMCYGLQEMTVQFSRMLSMATSSGGNLEMPAERAIEVSECISRETAKAAKSVLRAMKGAQS